MRVGAVHIALADDGAELIVRIYRAAVHIGFYGMPVACVQQFCEVDFPHHRRHHVAVFQMEVVIRPVKVGRHDGDVISSVLEIVALAHLQTCYFRYRVLFIGIFKR